MVRSVARRRICGMLAEEQIVREVTEALLADGYTPDEARPHYWLAPGEQSA